MELLGDLGEVCSCGIVDTSSTVFSEPSPSSHCSSLELTCMFAPSSNEKPDMQEMRVKDSRWTLS